MSDKRTFTVEEALRMECPECGHVPAVTLSLCEQLRERDAQIRALHAYQAESDRQVAEFEAERDHYRAALAAQTARLKRVRRLAYAADAVAGCSTEVRWLDDALEEAWAALQPGDLEP